MPIDPYKKIDKKYQSVRPINLYKEWTFVDTDFSSKNNLEDWLSDITASALTASQPSYFPTPNIKYARYYPSETGSLTEPNDDIISGYDDKNILSYNYLLGNDDRFYPTYQSQSGWMNLDGTYQRMVHYSLRHLFYGDQGVYKHLLNGTGSILKNEAIIFEFPRRYIGDSIEKNTLLFKDVSNVWNLPYGESENSNGYTPYNNTPSGNLNPLASNGIELVDDGYGNIFDTNYSSSVQRGNIFYQLGLVVITDEIYARYFKEYLITSGSLV